MRQIADAFDRDVGRRKAGEMLRLMRIVALSHEDRGDAASPHALHGGQDASLVVHQDIVVSGMAPLDVVEFALLVDVDQDVPVDSFV